MALKLLLGDAIRLSRVAWRHHGSSVGWSLVQSLAGRGLGLLTFLIVASHLDLTTLGWVSLTLSLIGVAQASCLQPVVITCIRSSETLSLGKVRSALFRLAVGSYLIVLSASLILVFVTKLSVLSWMLGVAGVSLVSAPLSTSLEASLKRELRIADFSRVATAAGVIGALITVGIAACGLPELSLLLQSAWTNALTALGLYLHIRRHPLRLRGGTADFPWPDYWNLARGSLTWGFSLRLDQLFIGALLGPAAVGAYSIAYRLVYAVVDVCASALGPVLLANFARLERVQVGASHSRAQGLAVLGAGTGVTTVGVVSLPLAEQLNIDHPHNVAIVVNCLIPFGIAAVLSATGIAALNAIGDSKSIRSLYVQRLLAGCLFIPCAALAAGTPGVALGVLLAETAPWWWRAQEMGRATSSPPLGFLRHDVRLLVAACVPAMLISFIALQLFSQ